ncbi:hypothetical protein WPS_35690 [Vulcanimicrobium alpinum]|uniref:Uncharacterized protein n=1 Tax=Vulcanimicrobium alpinum TaxID=3016050 RepID=A0AAN2C8P8_UNVUL|nr:hypothetical protein [Vulcanimicrobium alpinum]BDE04909.1 hypothetical protein WPS_01850 [Vulcanimicrobium alpinum]BDE05029.1 hypothetical protein WPS_03050 [Vulcanimicrobium alpinum]BDE05406.1 hypothetical protein WPS_06820 [Vulcanimicrobium alpinum]BDE05489.1 hypothetical protein WPS_07650 [Vulcanimicrobium alpinum]BDE06261.1 hypothetical protein WPS_15370 [Vulcanimicrobium alpinum]
MLGTIDPGYGGVQEKLVAGQIEVTPDALAMIVLGALPIAFWTATRALPFKPNIDPISLEIEL